MDNDTCTTPDGLRALYGTQTDELFAKPEASPEPAIRPEPYAFPQAQLA